METLENGIIELPDEIRQVNRPAPNEAELRADLADAIAKRREADKRAAAAKDTARRAEGHRLDARRYVDEFRKGHEAKMRELRDAHAKTVSEAIRAGRHVPGMPALPGIDSTALAAAESQHDALEVSATYLAIEANEAATEAGKAMDAVRTAAVAVMDHDGKRIFAELIAARDIFWRLEEQISGFCILDEARPGGPRFTALKDEIVVKINRQQTLAAERPELQERWKYNRYIDGLNADARQQWQDYHRRLCEDHTAVLDATEESSQ